MALLTGGVQEGFPEEVTCAESGLLRKSQPRGDQESSAPGQRPCCGHTGTKDRVHRVKQQRGRPGPTMSHVVRMLCPRVGVCTRPEMCVGGHGR